MTIQERLDSVKRRTKLHEAAAVAISLVTFALVFFATEIALDRLFLLDRRFRAAALIAFAALGGVAILAGLLLAVRRISDLFAARALEREFPQLRQSLITYVQMRSGDALGSDYALELIESRLEKDLETADLGPSMRRRLRILAVTAGVVAALFVGSSVLTAGSGFIVCLERALRPDLFVAPPTVTRVMEVGPGDQHILVSAPVTVSARLEGAVPPSVQVYLSYEEGTWFSVPMKEESGRWTATLPGAQASYRYFVAAADTRSDQFRVDVVPPPVLTNITASLDLPAYTKLGQKDVTGGDFDALPQSYVTLRGFPNRPFKSVAMVFDDGTRIPFRIRGTERAVAEFTATTGGSYRIEAVDEFGLRNPSPQRFRIEVRGDRAPEVTIVSPGPDAEITPDDPLRLAVDAVDDYGIVRMELVYVRRGQKEARLALPFAPAQGTRQTFELRPQEFGLEAPDAMLYWIEAADRAPKPNVTRSAVHTLQLRRRPADDLAAYEPLKRSLRDLAANDSTRKRFGLEETAEKSDELRDRESKALDKLRDLLSKQRDVLEKIRDLGQDRDDELRRIREELRQMMEDAKKRVEETRELPSRGVNKQESLADAVASKLSELARRAEAMRKRLEREQQPGDAKRTEALRQAAKRAADAAKRFEDAAQNLRDRQAGPALDGQADARRDLEAAQKALEDALAGALSEEDRKKAEELAKIEKMLQERTEEMRERATPEEAERLKRAQKAMQDAQRALQQGDPSGAMDAAEEALEQIEGAQESLEPQEPSAEIPEEMAKALVATLKEMLKEQEAVRTATREMDGRRQGGILKKEDLDALRSLAKREGALAEKAREAWRDLERENAEVYRWMIENIRATLQEIRDLMDAEDRTDGTVQSQQADVVEKLKQLIDALKPSPKSGGGGGGGGGGKPIQVGLEAQIKLIRAMQADLLTKTQAIRARADGGLSDTDRILLDRLYQQQEEIRTLAADLAAALGGDK